MTSYLYVLSIGPVQDFISAARRTRDLWFGSHLLSEISKAAAREIAESGQLIFPALKAGDKEMEPDSRPGAFNVANIILAELNDGVNPAELNELVKDSACREWMQYAEGAKELAEYLAPGFIRTEMWKEQVSDVIEFYSAWVPLRKNNPEYYQKDRERLMRLLGGRKAIRNFSKAKKYPGIPKSSLDGARESILEKNKEITKELALKMRLQAGEQLCAVGLTKRLGRRKEKDQKDLSSVVLEAFPSVVRVALDPWIRGVNESEEDARMLLEDIKRKCDENTKAEGKKDGKERGYIAQGTGWLRNGKRRYSSFPFDGQVLHLPSIIRMMKAKEKSRNSNGKNRDCWKGWEAQLSDDDRKDLKTIKDQVERLQKSGETTRGEMCFGLGEPERYLAILVADGDRMGKVISARKYKEQHCSLSKKLAEFAEKAREIVDNEYHGCLVYSGGDDVLAFVPLDFCLQAARDLHDCFGKFLKDYPDDDGKVPTLSVGIAICHSMEPLEDLLSAGREAEEAAKKGTGPNDERDGLAVHLYPRSGTPTKIRERWDPKGEISLDKRLLTWAEMHCKDELPDSAAYDMHELAEDYMNWDGTSKEELQKLIIADSWRLLKRKKAGSISSEGLKRTEIEDLLAGVDSQDKICRRADELILARRLAASMEQAKWNFEKKEKTNEVVS